MIGALPKTLTVNGVEYSIRTNFKDILKIIAAFNDPELEDKEKIYICLLIIYRDFDSLPQKDYEEAFKAALDFMDCGMKNDGHKSPRIYGLGARRKNTLSGYKQSSRARNTLD